MSLNCSCGRCDSNGTMCPFVWSRLPHDLMIELFSRLSLKSLLEFRCLSKACDFSISQLFIPKLAASAPLSGFVFQWENFYKSEYYLKNQWRKSQLKPFVPEWFYGYVTCGGSFDISGGKFVHSFLANLPFKPQKDDFWGCFNGFLVVGNTSNIPVQYYICNPATRQTIAVPVNPMHLEGNSFVGLAFDPLDPPPHNFKIVRISRCPEIASVNHPPELDVFSSATGNWVNHPVHVENPKEILGFKWLRRSLYAHGVFYMLSMAKYLLCFDLRDADRHNKKLTPRTIKLPHTSEDDRLGLLEVSEGCLYYAGDFESNLLVWTYQANNEVSPWELKYMLYNIRVRQSNRLPLFHRFIRGRFIVFAADLSNEVIYIGDKYMVYSYNIKTGQPKVIYRMGKGNIYCAETRFYAYSPSLVKLHQ